MQAIAKEFNLSEMVFLTGSTSERHAAAVRIFTPRVELPFAGHPTVGAAVVLALQNRLTGVRLEEKIGVVTCIVDKLDKRTGHARFALPQLPEEIAKPPDRTAMALALGVNADDLGCGLYQPAVFSAGVPFHLVPVKNTHILGSLSLNLGGWERTFPAGNHGVYCFTAATGEAGVDFAARMFAPGMGLREDPGTGSAAAALIGLLARHTSFADGQAEYVIRQGLEMGRPCRISVQLKQDGGVLTHGGIGGNAVIVGEGTLDLDY
jgi:trans-2,3-dihydro-3-hydroxyanthranilate isomerase